MAITVAPDVGLHPSSGEQDTHMSASRIVSTGSVSEAGLLPGSVTASLSELQLLSNGHYHVMVTNTGGGYSRWKTLALTRWREDATCDNWGPFCYVRDLASGHYWSTTHQPTLRRADRCEVIVEAGRVSFRRRDQDIQVDTDIAVSPNDDIELRRVSISNLSAVPRKLDVTSYAEIVLGDPAADIAHPAFEKLFVETEILRDDQAILCKRRARTLEELTPWMFHLLISHGTRGTPRGNISFETDRMRFVGRGRSLADPQALDDQGALSDSEGAVLDPVAAIRCGVNLAPGEAGIVDLITGVADSRDACIALLRRYRDPQVVERILPAASTRARALLTTLHASEADARLYTELARSVIYANPALRADERILAQNAQGQSGLWGYGISGDLPIVLLQISDAANIVSARQVLNAHAYWRLQGLAADLIILCDDGPARRPSLVDDLTALVKGSSASGELLDKSGGIFIRPLAQVPAADRVLLQAVARVVLGNGSLAEQLDRSYRPSTSIPLLRASLPDNTRGRAPTGAPKGPPEPDLVFRNGLGGFTPDGREYVISLTKEHMTPSPWVNVLANPSFGTLISESGSANTWSENAQQFRLTPWSNDPVGDANTEAFYLRDEETGQFWSPTLLPCAGAAPYVTRHGFGYSHFEHIEGGIRSGLTVYVAMDAPIKFAVLSVVNESGRARRLSATGYLEWVLGDDRTKTVMHVVNGVDPSSGALLARNPYNTEFEGRCAFFDIDEMAESSWCADRREFLGPCGTLRNPAAMSRTTLSGVVGAGLDPCAAIRIPFELAGHESRQITFRLGAAANAEEASRLARQWRGAAPADTALAAVKAYWTRTLGAVQIETPDRSLDMVANGWLVYQVLGCRLWARNAFYQASGAFGFRDQLQDVMALVHAAPVLVREHILRSASRQYPEGDVQHWWHPPSGRGVRTRCSDDFLWLPLAACRYVAVTGDTEVLDEPVHFLDGPLLKEGEATYYALPKQGEQAASLYEHCRRSVDHGLRFGTHGVPLMGTGDWNDGMNLVGEGGKGESVWLGFFLYSVLRQFGDLAKRRGDALFASRCTTEAARLQSAIERSGWDGDWYRRGWFDDGSPLGTAGNAECQITSIPQSWSVLSGAGDSDRSRRAMHAVDAHLVDRDAALVRLLDPPFDHSKPSPGYIQGYVRGVRENGGQYTHAAVWATMAFAALGDPERAWELVRMINPINHAESPTGIAVYKSEPYVIASDVYSRAPHAGRGGWTWYTGSAGWMYRLIVESLLGLTVDSNLLRIAPFIPRDWKSFKIHYRYHDTTYDITVLQVPGSEAHGATVDGVAASSPAITMVNDCRAHAVEVRISPGASASPTAEQAA
jgi:cyclic beta-1,2-glucan synthetase